MAYKTILTFLPTVARAERVLDVALPIAESHDAHIIGVHVMPDVMNFLALTGGDIPVGMIEDQRRYLESEAEKIRAAFERRAGPGKARSEWRMAVDAVNDITQQFINVSLCADLIVTDQAAADFTRGPSSLAARMVLGTARPVLVVPSAGSFSTIGKRPIVAWNGDKEAARAAFDAVPLMQNAELVRILSVDPETGAGRDMLSLGDELAICLARHGLKAETVVSRKPEVAIGDELLNRISDYGADLLVMGCYGHSRYRELFFGGATRDILDRMTVPVLMSH